MKSFIVVLLEKPRQFSKFGSIAEIPIVDFPENLFLTGTGRNDQIELAGIPA
jgi:hypothetical protein